MSNCSHSLFLDPCALTTAAAEEVKFGAANGASANDLDRIDVRRVKREDPLDALAEADLADGEARAEPAIGAGDADALEILDSGTLAFDHANADTKRVAGAEFGDGALLGEALDLLGLELLDDVHVSSLSSVRRAPEGGGLRASQ